MRVQFTVEATVPDASLARVQGYLEAQRRVMIDPGGDEPGIVGELIAARAVYGVPVTDLPAVGPARA